VPDHKPPRIDGDERHTVLALLQYQRDSLVRKVAGVNDAVARHSPVGSGTTLLWLVKHMAAAETTWVLRRFAGHDEDAGDTVGPSDTPGSVTAAYRATWARVDAVVDAAGSLEQHCLAGGDPPVPLRWVLMHLLEETARHAGHADILRELADGSTGR